MNSTICTLFEGSYHYGVAALANSLYYNGFRGEIYAGYRGDLPAWVTAVKTSSSLSWPDASTMTVATGLQIHFLPLKTDYHLTNYKPDFMLRLWEGVASNNSSIFYFDPDIVITTPWVVFEEWVGCGVALCEDINSPLAEYHPMRLAWRRYFGLKGFSLKFKDIIYANGGFLGVSKQDIGFITTWQAIQEAMAPAIGGLNISSLTGTFHVLPFAPFGRTDQDALNATVEAWQDGNVSFVGQEAMSFKTGMSLMSHAIGRGKPWLLHFLAQAFSGNPPRRADRDYWQFANGPITTQPSFLVKRKVLFIQIAAFVGRFYSRK